MALGQSAVWSDGWKDNAGYMPLFKLYFESLCLILEGKDCLFSFSFVFLIAQCLHLVGPQ